MSNKIFTFVAFDDETITAFKFTTEKYNTIRYIKKVLTQSWDTAFPYKENRKDRSITICDPHAKKARNLVLIFKRLVKHEVFQETTSINFYDTKCLKEVSQEAKIHGNSYKLSTMGEPGYFCSPQIISKLVGLGLIVLNGEFSCLKKSDKTNRKKKTIVHSNVVADTPLPDISFNGSPRIFGYVDTRPVLVLYSRGQTTSYVVDGIQPYLSDVEETFKSSLTIYEPVPRHISVEFLSRYLLYCKKPQLGKSGQTGRRSESMKL
ncbi:hypothetical protein Golomagni_05358 [Golovinomyces magnicellulatus]|nr:hypothetical protein Golomagni_05358 [Golovinomyces magnicellulatus]